MTDRREDKKLSKSKQNSFGIRFIQNFPIFLENTCNTEKDML